MSRKFKSQASSARAASALTGGSSAFGSSFQTNSSPLSYVTELPDLSQITEPNVVVIFKNLGKKDSTTKAKALEDLHEYCTENAEQGLLQAWADIYPRTAIDNSRRVRQLAHTLQGNLTSSTGKRIAPLLSKLVGAWLAGTFDSDKSVARSSRDALEKAFTTSEKRTALWSLYRDAISSYIEDAVVVQTLGTLSDERTTSADDAQAKYVRVIGTSVNMLAEMLNNKLGHDSIISLLSVKKVWEFVYHHDAYLRRSVCDLAVIACKMHAEQLDWTTISTCFLSKGLHSNQSSSTRQFTAALLALTKQRPEIWTTDYTAKTAIFKRLCQFLKQGSQNGPEEVWSNIAAMFRLVPPQVWTGTSQLDIANDLAEALRTGATQPSERMNAAAAWAAYVQTCLWFAQKLAAERADFLDQQLAPIVKQYVTRSEEQQWKLTTRGPQICKGILIGMIRLEAVPVAERTWSDVTNSVVDRMKLSQPESSKTYRSSQDATVDQTRRMFGVKSEVLKDAAAVKLAPFLEQEDLRLMESAITLLRTRNGKPYGAAAIIDIITEQPTFDKENAVLQKFLKSDVPSLLDSPSAEKLATISLRSGVTSILEPLIENHSANINQALCSALSRVKLEDINSNSQARLLGRDLADVSDRRVLIAIMQNPSLIQLGSVVAQRIQQDSMPDKPDESKRAALMMVEEMLGQSQVPQTLTSEPYRSSLLANLLAIADSEGDLSEIAISTIEKLNKVSESGTGAALIVQQQLNGEGMPLSIFTLLDLASDVTMTKSIDLKTIMPTQSAWDKALSYHTATSRPSSLAVTNPLQGLIYTIEPAASAGSESELYDHDDFSLAFRLVIFVTKMLTSDLTVHFKSEHLRGSYQAYPIALQLVNEKLTVDDANKLWLQSTAEVLQEAADVVSEGNRIVQSWLDDEAFLSHWLSALPATNRSDVSTYLVATAWTNIASFYIDQNGPARFFEQYEADLKTVYKSDNLVQSVALLTVLQEYFVPSLQGKKVLNEIVAAATETKGDQIKPLILLNVLLNNSGDGLDTIPPQRMVFLLKNLIRLLEDWHFVGAQAEVLKLLTKLVLFISDVYGDHWDTIMVILAKLWSGRMDIAVMNASIRLYARLMYLSQADNVNEDLQDAWKSAKTDLNMGLINCLRQLGEVVCYPDQPRSITADLVRRTILHVDLQFSDETFILLSSSIEAVQNAAFAILHRTIPLQQESLSVELVLEKRAIHLPQDLLQIIADGDANPRKYMLAWKLAFDHFSHASHKLHEIYANDIKESGHVDPLMTHICNALRIVDTRPIDASKFVITDFKLDEAESAMNELQWLAVNNYYNALLHVPGIVKDWFISQKNRVKSPLEIWTQKYISPSIIAASLTTVTEWANEQIQGEDDRPLTVKFSPRGSEITAAITVDPESPPISISISLSSSHPLDLPTVIPRARVGVSEKNWQSWMNTIKIIIISTGSIIEGLIAFKRNVHGALKGQTECAICYSIIGTDMQTPNKKCGTCKNMFHGTCLFRWFKSSNSSSCPLCRNNFNYA